MDENAIKAAVLTRIRREARGRSLPIVTSEFSLNGTGIRADLAVLDGFFYGVEIKSARDTLKRLPSQMEGYARYFDRTILIVAPKHLRGLRTVDLHGAEVWRQEILTDWQLYAPGEQRQITGHWLQHLLTADEERRANRAIENQQSQFPAMDVDRARRTEFENAFSKRYGETSANFWKAVHGRRITTDDLKLLSRFYADRLQARELEEDRRRRWVEWAAAMHATTAYA
ncbi:MAG: hypothetical protein QOG72_1362 [Sphingomonadales bacterium]|jgi:hypothetical protein|nr:hypothetical protein [Sphingomonadales bacterium]